MTKISAYLYLAKYPTPVIIFNCQMISRNYLFFLCNIICNINDQCIWAKMPLQSINTSISHRPPTDTLMVVSAVRERVLMTSACARSGRRSLQHSHRPPTDTLMASVGTRRPPSARQSPLIRNRPFLNI